MYALNDDEKLVPLVEFLVKNGAEIDCETDYWESPLSVASHAGRFDAVRCLRDAGADATPLRWTEMLNAAALGSCNDLQRLLDKGGSLNDRDRWERTPWLLAVLTGDLEKAKLLHSAGADIEDRERGGHTALMNCAARGNAAMLQWLVEIGADIEAADDARDTALLFAAHAGDTDCVQLLLKAGAEPNRKNEYEENAMSMASTEQIIRLLASAGADIDDINTEMKRALCGLHGGDTLKISKAEYHWGNRPQFGRSNPEVMDIPFWREMVRAGSSAYEAKAQFADTDNMEPVWCFDRFGMSFMELPDGRFVQIGGEHEDFYDPDFCIYNDVIIHERSGRFQIMGYPKEIFPPTDFHSATYFEGDILIIGGLGYQGSRHFGVTPIYRLNCQLWQIEKLKSSGENPGWIYDHKVSSADRGVLVLRGGKVCIEHGGEEQQIENKDKFRLDVTNLKWTRL